MPDILFETENIQLRPIVESDFNALKTIWADPEVMYYSIAGIQTDEQIRERILKSKKEYLIDGMGRWSVILKNTNQLIGECGISAQEVGDQLEYEIGYRFAKPCWGKGYATQAATCCRELGFGKFGLQRLISIIDPKNQASIRVAEKIGMIKEKEFLFHNIPVLLYNLDKDEED